MNQCPVCHGNRVVESQKTGNVQICPYCDGSGVWEGNVVRLPRTYTWGNASSIVLAAGAPGVDQSPALVIDGNYDFELVKGVATSTGIFADQIFDQSTRGWQSFGVYITSANRWGTAQNPFNYEAPLIIPKRQTLQGNFHDMSGAPNTVQACFCGFDLHINEGN